MKQNLRWLLRRPTYAVTVLTSMTLGFTLLTIVVAAFSAFMLRPLGITDAEELVRIREMRPGQEGTLNVSPAAWHLWRQRELPFTDIALSTGRQLNLTGGEFPERFSAASVSANLFDVLGIAPDLGRDFAPGEDQAGRDGVVILSHALWTRRFEADPGIVGESLVLDETTYTVIGVMPEGFSYPYDAQVWIPHVLGDAVNAPGGWSYNVIGRIPEGMSFEQATERMSAVAAAATEERPDLSHAPGVRLADFRTEMLDGMDRLIIILLAGSAFVVVLTVLNTCNITLARAVADARNDAVRLSMGAQRWALYRDATTRAVIVTGVSAALAIWFARFAAAPFSGLRGLSALDQFPTDVHVDTTAILVTLTAAMISAAVIAIAPIWLQSRIHLRDALSGSGKGVQAVGRSPLMGGMTVMQITVSMVLLVGAAMVGGTYQQLMNRDRGFDDRDLLVANVTLPAARYPDAPAKQRFVDEVLARIDSIPGVVGATSASTTPALAGSWGAAYNIDGRPPPEPQGYYITSHRLISDDYFSVMGIPIVAGRAFDSRDAAAGVQSVIVSREFADTHWPGENAVGKRLRRGGRDPAGREWMTIVGVSEDVVEAGESDLWDKHIQWYLPMTVGNDNDLSQTNLLIRVDGALPGIGGAIREAIWSVDPAMGLERVVPIRTLMGDTFERERFTATLFAMFGVTSLAVAVIGLYGFLAFRSALRRSEFGIRMALGARRAQVGRDVLADATRMFIIGAAISVPLCWWLARAVRAGVYGVETSGWSEVATVAALLFVVTLVAAAVPATRAARTEPMTVLRNE